MPSGAGCANTHTATLIYPRCEIARSLRPCSSERQRAQQPGPAFLESDMLVASPGCTRTGDAGSGAPFASSLPKGDKQRAKHPPPDCSNPHSLRVSALRPSARQAGGHWFKSSNAHHSSHRGSLAIDARAMNGSLAWPRTSDPRGRVGRTHGRSSASARYRSAARGELLNS